MVPANLFSSFHVTNYLSRLVLFRLKFPQIGRFFVMHMQHLLSDTKPFTSLVLLAHIRSVFSNSLPHNFWQIRFVVNICMTSCTACFWFRTPDRIHCPLGLLQKLVVVNIAAVFVLQLPFVSHEATLTPSRCQQYPLIFIMPWIWF